MAIESLGLEIHVVANIIHNKMNQTTMKVENLTFHQCLILQHLTQNADKEIYQKDIEQLFSIRRSTANQILRILEKRGFIERNVSAEDSRKNILTATQNGITASRNLTQNMYQFMKKLHGDIPENELEQFEKTLMKLRQNIE